MGTNADGDFIPSYMQSTYSNSQDNGYTQSLNEFSFRYGQVVQIYPPDKEGNTNKRFTEYDVNVFHKAEGGGSFTLLPYRNCQIGSLFGGVADFFQYTLRAASSDGKTGQAQLGLNSMVLLLCINGNIRQATIIGGCNHPQRPAETDQGHHLTWEFNGIRALVNADGEFSVRRRGVTDANGDPVKAKDKNNNAFFLMDKAGALTLGNGQKTQSISVGGNDSKSISFIADESLNVNSNGTVLIVSNSGHAHNPGNSQGGYIGLNGSSEAMVRGSTYRENEKLMFSSLSGKLKAIAEAVLNAASYIGSAAAAPGAQTLTQAASFLVQAGSSLNDCATAIDDFEGNSSEYVSNTVFTG